MSDFLGPTILGVYVPPYIKYMRQGVFGIAAADLRWEVKYLCLDAHLSFYRFCCYFCRQIFLYSFWFDMCSFFLIQKISATVWFDCNASQRASGPVEMYTCGVWWKQMGWGETERTTIKRGREVKLIWNLNGIYGVKCVRPFACLSVFLYFH